MSEKLLYLFILIPRSQSHSNHGTCSVSSSLTSRPASPGLRLRLGIIAVQGRLFVVFVLHPHHIAPTGPAFLSRARPFEDAIPGSDLACPHPRAMCHLATFRFASSSLAPPALSSPPTLSVHIKGSAPSSAPYAPAVFALRIAASLRDFCARFLHVRDHPLA
ncbi:hypothetical protein B0H19DRAFT_1257362 [Mycena capillaripes]|nr:hypothetical protein B0H19DRAFT_1257362 [Mycena capillaripes]